MRIPVLLLSVLIASCMRFEPDGGPRVCVVDVQMPRDSDRQRVLGARREAVIESVRRGEVLIAPLQQPGLMIVTQDAECAAFQRLGLGEEAFQFRERVMTVDQANAVLASELSSRPLSHLAVRACVVRFRERDDEQFARLTEVLGFVGLRGVQMEGADGEIFVAADEPCDLLGAILTEAHEQDAGGVPDSRHECSQVSLAACGFPAEILAPG